MQPETMLAIANFHTIYDVRVVEEALEKSRKIEGLGTIHERMLKKQGRRLLTTPSSIKCVDELDDDCPHFRAVTATVRKAIALSLDGRETATFTPALFLGKSGIGKTYYAQRLARLLGTDFAFIPMNNMTAGWVLSGSSSQWKNAKAGKVATALIDGQNANPVFVVDEIDKAGGDQRYDPLNPLYTLLEQETSGRFVDEFVEIEIDASWATWFFTANKLLIPDALLNRMRVFEIPEPTNEEMAGIADRLYRKILSQHTWKFESEPRKNVVSKLSRLLPRALYFTLIDAFGTAKYDGRDYLTPEDIRPQDDNNSHMGFVSN